MKGLMARDMIAMDKNRVFLVVMLALCLFYTFSDMYVTGVMLMPMLFSTVCGNMVRNDLSAPIRRTLFTLPFSRREYAGEKYLVSIVPACVLAVVFALVVLAVSLDMGTDGLFAIITSAPAWALYGIAPCWAWLRLPSPSWCRCVRCAQPNCKRRAEDHRRSGGRIIHRRGRPIYKY